MKKVLVLLSMVSLALLASCGKPAEKPSNQDVATWTTTESNVVVPSEEPTTGNTISIGETNVEMEADAETNTHSGVNMEIKM